jgi:hypothetical protein
MDRQPRFHSDRVQMRCDSFPIDIYLLQRRFLKLLIAFGAASAFSPTEAGGIKRWRPRP